MDTFFFDKLQPNSTSYSTKSTLAKTMQKHTYRLLNNERREIRFLNLLAIIPSSQHGYEDQCVSGRLEYKYLNNDEEGDR